MPALTENPSEAAAGTNALSEGKKIAGCYVLRRNLTPPDGASVWLASDEVLGKEVTLHFIPPAVLGDARAMAELRQEVKKNRQLIHPNILRVYDFVEDGNCAAISMDRIDGESLAGLLQQKGQLDPSDVKPWLAELAETLGDAHRIQLFHRDLAPVNLFVRPTGGLLVANFGISRAILNALERAGLAKGGEAHMAYLTPQQLDGEKPQVSDDVYGLGVLLYELLAGCPPFVGDDLVPRIRREVPVPIADVRASSRGGSPVPASWEKAIAASLAKTPDQRPRSVAEMVARMGQDIGEAQTRTSATPAPVPVSEPKGEPIQIKGGVEQTDALGSAVETTLAGAEQVAEPVVAAKNGNHLAQAGTNGGTSHLAREKTQEKPEKRPAGASHSPDRLDSPPPPPKTASRKPPVKGALSANFPDLDRPRSKAPLVWLSLAAIIIGTGIYVKNLPDTEDGKADGSIARIDGDSEFDPNLALLPPGSVAATGSGKSEETILPDPTPITPEAGVPGNLTPALPPTVAKEPRIAAETPTKAAPKALISSDPLPLPAPNPLVPESLIAASGGQNPKATTAKPGPDAATPPDKKSPVPAAVDTSIPTAPVQLPAAPQQLSKLALPEKATVSQLEQAKKEREGAIEKTRQASAAAEAARQETLRRLDLAKAEQDKLQKDIESRRKTLAPIIQQAEAFEAERKKLEDAHLKAKDAAAEAAKAADAAKHAYEAAVAKGEEKLQARQAAEAEFLSASTTHASRSKEIEDLGQVMAKADTLRQQMRTSEAQLSQDLEKLTASLDQARQAEMDIQRKANAEKIAGLEKKLHDFQAQLGRLNAALGPLKELGDAGKDAAKQIEEKAGAASAEIGSLQTEITRLSGGVSPAKTTAPVTPPKPEPAPAVSGAGVTNSIGMKFVPVGDVQFSVYLTTRKDFEAFATATGLKSEAWRNPGFKQDPDHPVVNVTWREAEAFCKWLTEKERKAGGIKGNELYRLPTDLEWSKAVGLPPEPGATAEERDMGVQDVYPWGTQWPPPAGAGNYAGEETQTEIPIPNYNDGYPATSPVGKFKANALGLYDMGGNVWQWVSDYWNSENRAKTLRGGSWYNGAIPLSLLSSCRISSSPDTLHDTYGFRIVKAAEAPKGKKR
jgi:formylglycine-generating enzyme required for sulfatase activity/serine/threonine protein kinase